MDVIKTEKYGGEILCPLRTIVRSARNVVETGPYNVGDKSKIEYTLQGDYLTHCSALLTVFLPCIKEQCAAFNKEEKICNYLSGKRNVEIRI